MRQGLLLPVLRSPILPTAPHIIHSIPRPRRSSSSPAVSRPGILLVGCSWCSSRWLVAPRRQPPSSSRLLRPGKLGRPASCRPQPCRGGSRGRQSGPGAAAAAPEVWRVLSDPTKKVQRLMQLRLGASCAPGTQGQRRDSRQHSCSSGSCASFGNETPGWLARHVTGCQDHCWQGCHLIISAEALPDGLISDVSQQATSKLTSSRAVVAGVPTGADQRRWPGLRQGKLPCAAEQTSPAEQTTFSQLGG